MPDEKCVSEMWAGFYKNMENMDYGNFAKHPMIQKTIAVKIGYPFSKHYGECREEIAKIVEAFEEHPWLAGVANERFDKDIPINKSSEQYAYQLGLLMKAFPDLNGLRILEIGAGFGGFARMLLRTFPKVKSYTVLDVPPMLKLCKAFLVADSPKTDLLFADAVHLGTAAPLAIHRANNKEGTEFDLLISNYCLTETTPEYVGKLCQVVFPSCNNFFIIDGGKQAMGIQALYTDWLSRNTHLRADDYNALPHQYQKVYVGHKKEIPTNGKEADGNPGGQEHQSDDGHNAPDHQEEGQGVGSGLSDSAGVSEPGAQVPLSDYASGDPSGEVRPGPVD